MEKPRKFNKSAILERLENISKANGESVIRDGTLYTDIICKQCNKQKVTTAFIPCNHLACEMCDNFLEKCKICNDYIIAYFSLDEEIAKYV